MREQAYRRRLPTLGRLAATGKVAPMGPVTASPPWRSMSPRSATRAWTFPASMPRRAPGAGPVVGSRPIRRVRRRPLHRVVGGEQAGDGRRVVIRTTGEVFQGRRRETRHAVVEGRARFPHRPYVDVTPCASGRRWRRLLLWVVHGCRRLCNRLHGRRRRRADARAWCRRVAVRWWR